MSLESFGPLISIISLAITAFMAWSLYRLNKSQDAAAVAAVTVAAKLQEVNTATDGKLDGLQMMGAATHELVNSKMAAQLLLTKTALRRVAELTKDPKDIEAAELAGRLYGDHQAKQATVDAQPGTDAEKRGG